MHSDHTSAPTPDLRIVATDCLFPHEEHDSQRADPLIDRLSHEDVVINPPIVASMDGDEFVILDGANRCYAFGELGYPHSLVQVVSYTSGDVELDTWHHIVADWNADEFIQQLGDLHDMTLVRGEQADAVATIRMQSGDMMSVLAATPTTEALNAVLRRLVAVYQSRASLHRAADIEPEQAWTLYPTAAALVAFKPYAPHDIVNAARQRAYLPPGVSRHIVHGRAIRVNYPIDLLRDQETSLAAKNDALQTWLREKLANRQVRYYAESTYQFDE